MRLGLRHQPLALHLFRRHPNVINLHQYTAVRDLMMTPSLSELARAVFEVYPDLVRMQFPEPLSRSGQATAAEIGAIYNGRSSVIRALERSHVFDADARRELFASVIDYSIHHGQDVYERVCDFFHQTVEIEDWRILKYLLRFGFVSAAEFFARDHDIPGQHISEVIIYVLDQLVEASDSTGIQLVLDNALAMPDREVNVENLQDALLDFESQTVVTGAAQRLVEPGRPETAVYQKSRTLLSSSFVSLSLE